MTIGIAPRRGKPRWLASLGVVALVGGLFSIGNVVLAAPPANDITVNLDQCRNGGLVTSGTQTVTDCTGSGSGSSGWVNGNAGASNAHYAEGESISYRARLANLKNNDQVTLILGYDVIHNGHDALDFLTDKNRWQQPEVAVGTHLDNPCSGVSGCSGSPQNLAIPTPPTHIKVDVSKTLAGGCQTSSTTDPVQQPTTSFGNIPSAQRVMEFFGATPLTFTYLAPAPSLLDKNGDQEQQVQVTFTATSVNPVLAWGAHIASRLDWGCSGAPQSASGISGSPYHMRIKSAIVNGTSISLGNQDRSLSASAVVFLNPGIATTLSATTGAIGDTVHDSATLSLSTSTAGGSVTYTVYTDSSCTVFANVGSGAVLGNAGTVTVTNAVVPDSNNITFNHAGTFYWQAAYSGDGNNAAATSTCTSEIVVISPNSPSLTTSLSATSINTGDSVTDTATLSGATSGDTQPITISVYSGSGSGACVAANLVTSATATPATSGNGQYSATFSTLTAGSYEFQASITADGDNNAASSLCGTEPLTVKNSPNASTAQNLIPNDTFTLSGGAGTFGETGHTTVNFYLFPPGTTCGSTHTGDANVIHFTGTLSSGGVASTSNTTTTVSAEGTYSWYVSWGGDSLNNAAASNCVETFAIDNDINNP
jgi:hypothetical protein